MRPGEDKFTKFSPEDKLVEPGSHVKFEVELVQDVYLEENFNFIMLEGKYRVGKGTVTKIIE